jgi:hypothetical protein
MGLAGGGVAPPETLAKSRLAIPALPATMTENQIRDFLLDLWHHHR